MADPGGRVADFHAGDLSGSAQRNAEAVVGTFRDEFGPDVGIGLDVAFRFKLPGAIKLARAMEPFDLMWLEVESPELLKHPAVEYPGAR